MILISNETNGLPIAPVSIYQDFKNPVKYIVTVRNLHVTNTKRDVSDNMKNLVSYGKLMHFKTVH